MDQIEPNKNCLTYRENKLSSIFFIKKIYIIAQYKIIIYSWASHGSVNSDNKK